MWTALLYNFIVFVSALFRAGKSCPCQLRKLLEFWACAIFLDHSDSSFFICLFALSQYYCTVSICLLKVCSLLIGPVGILSSYDIQILLITWNADCLLGMLCLNEGALSVLYCDGKFLAGIFEFVLLIGWIAHCLLGAHCLYHSSLSVFCFVMEIALPHCWERCWNFEIV